MARWLPTSGTLVTYMVMGVNVPYIQKQRQQLCQMLNYFLILKRNAGG